MKYKTSELTGVLLDAAVAKALYGEKAEATLKILSSGITGDGFLPSSNWAHGGPIIEREQIEVIPSVADDDVDAWRARKHDGCGIRLDTTAIGRSPLVASMRCFVIAKMGAEVDL